MAIFKALEFKGDRAKVLGRHATPVFENEWGAVNTPQLMLPETTISMLQQLYPKHNFKDVKIVTLKVEEI